MKRRATSQLHPNDDCTSYEEVYSSGEESQVSTSDRKHFKAERKTKVTEAVIEEQSNSFLSLLAALKDPEVGKKTEERLKKIEEALLENTTPRRILPDEKKSFLELANINCKLRLGTRNLGKGSMELIKFEDKNEFMVVFRNCIKKVMFSGVVNKFSSAKIAESKCKGKHEGKADLNLSVLQMPEMKITSCLMCGDDGEIQKIFKELEIVVGKFIETKSDS